MRLEDRERDAFRRERFERRDVDRRLRQPHPLGARPKRCSKSRTPQRTCVRFVAVVRERQDDVVVRLRDRRAVAGVALALARSASRIAA
jgi:hypothetical protein